jgi:hypothetical protein
MLCMPALLEDYFVDNNRSIRTMLSQHEEDTPSIELCGLGCFQYALLAVCAIANASDAVELLSISFILPNILAQFDASSKSHLHYYLLRHSSYRHTKGIPCGCQLHRTLSGRPRMWGLRG